MRRGSLRSRFARYIALGDSMSIDAYPGLDHAERTGRDGRVTGGLGATSLLFRNNDLVWPDFAAVDLVTLHPAIEYEPRASDGATTDDVLASQVSQIEASSLPTLVTLTAGGNDLLGILGRHETPAEGERQMERALGNLRKILGRVRAKLPRSFVLCATVYDPSDGLGKLEHMTLAPEIMVLLSRFNDAIRGLEARDVRVVDLANHFAGHGASVPVVERWYWCQVIIEPGWLGASEIRRLWLRALGVAA